MTLISVLIPVYNGIEFLEECLLSVINQTYDNWEVIIGINGHSKGSSVELKAIEIVDKIKNSYGLNENYKNYKNCKIDVNYYDTSGKPATMNKMVLDCSGDFIAVLDVDDYWLPKKLESQLPFLDNYDVIGTLCQYFGDENHSPAIPVGDLKEFNFFAVNPIINSSALIRRDLANWTEGEFYDDYDLWLNLFSNKKKFFNVDKILCMHRIHNQSSFNSIKNKENENNLNELRKKWFLFYMSRGVC